MKAFHKLNKWILFVFLYVFPFLMNYKPPVFIWKEKNSFPNKYWLVPSHLPLSALSKPAVPTYRTWGSAPQYPPWALELRAEFRTTKASWPPHPPGLSQPFPQPHRLLFVLLGASRQTLRIPEPPRPPTPFTDPAKLAEKPQLLLYIQARHLQEGQGQVES